LAQPRLFEHEAQPHQPERGRLQSENRRRAEGADHLVVAHVNDPDITFMPGAFAGDGQDYVRIDGCYRRVDHLEFCFRIARAQQRLEVTTGPIIGPGIAQRRRFAEDEDANRARRFVRLHKHRRRDSRQRRGEKAQTELVVLDEIVLAGDGCLLEEVRGMTIAADAQEQLDSRQQRQRQQRRCQPEHPLAASR
jgi:hypothetical protein